MELIKRLDEYSKSGAVPMHMPGHKRNVSVDYLKKLCADCDITEIDGFDNLHGAETILKDAMLETQKLWKSKRSFFLVNGTTCGILAAVRTLTSHGDSIIMSRNCHKSVFNAVELFALRPTYVLPEKADGFSFYAGVNVKSLKKAFNECPDCKLVIITSPTYEGIISPIEEIAEFVHSKGALLLVDEAHGSHLDLSEYFTMSAITRGADIVIQSVHKTLPSLTQTAVAHICSDRVDEKKMEKNLAVFQTSSPSYLLMSSIDGCVHFIKENANSLFKSWSDNIDEFHRDVSCLENLRIFKKSDTPFDFDKSKVVISCASCGISGSELSQILRSKYNIELEMSSADYVIAMTGLLDTKENFKRLSNALIEIDKTLNHCENESFDFSPFVPEMFMTPFEASESESLKMPFSDSVNKISAEYVWAYPPGIPLIVPGEVISNDFIRQTDSLIKNGVELHSTSSLFPEEISIISK